MKISLDIKALLRIILHASLVRIRAFTCLNKGPIYMYKCNVKTYIVDNKKVLAMVRAKYPIQNISIKLQCQILSISCTCLIKSPIWHFGQHGFAQGFKLNVELMISVYQCWMGMSFAKPITILYIIGISATIHKTKGQPLNFFKRYVQYSKAKLTCKVLEVYTVIKGLIEF